MHYGLAARTAPTLAIVRIVGASILAIAMLLAIWATFDPAAAQTACTTQSEVAERLTRDDAEASVAVGLATDRPGRSS